jgi:NTE family protein
MARIGLVLGAGGVTGDAFHRGVLRALLDAGWDARDADVIAGTSAGAMVGAHLRRPDAAPPTAHRDGTVHGARLGRAPDLSPLLAIARRPWRLRAGVVSTSLLPTGRHSTEFIASGVRHFFGRDWAERRLYICAVRGRDGAPNADLAHAVAASCAIPGFFHPVEIDGVLYVDGGVHSPTNADVLRGWELDLLLVSSPMSVAPRRMRPTLDLVPRLHANRYLRRETAAYRKRGVQVVTFEPGGELLQVMGVNPLHGGRIDEIEEASHERAAEILRAHPDAVGHLIEKTSRVA